MSITTVDASSAKQDFDIDDRVSVPSESSEGVLSTDEELQGRLSRMPTLSAVEIPRLSSASNSAFRRDATTNPTILARDRIVEKACEDLRRTAPPAESAALIDALRETWAHERAALIAQDRSLQEVENLISRLWPQPSQTLANDDDDSDDEVAACACVAPSEDDEDMVKKVRESLASLSLIEGVGAHLRCFMNEGGNDFAGFASGSRWPVSSAPDYQRWFSPKQWATRPVFTTVPRPLSASLGPAASAEPPASRASKRMRSDAISEESDAYRQKMS